MAGVAVLAMCAGSQSVHADDSVFSALYNREVTMDSRVKGAGASPQRWPLLTLTRFSRDRNGRLPAAWAITATKRPLLSA
jgi:hypothetical protein